jgi:predicted nucleotidyltransferase
MRTSRDVASVLFGRARRLLLGWLLGHPDEAFFLRQLARQTNLSPGSVQRELKALVDAGLVSRTTEGRQVYFQADRQSPVFPELQSLFVKTAGVADVLRDALGPLAGRITAAFVFRSAARGELQNTSDIDLMIVGEVSFADAIRALSHAQQAFGREVNPSVYSAEEFARKIRGGHHFLTSVLQEPHVFVLGDADDLGRLGAEEQVAQHSQNDATGDRRSARGRRARPARQRH